MISSSSLSVMVSKSANVSLCRETGGETKETAVSIFSPFFLNTELHSRGKMQERSQSILSCHCRTQPYLVPLRHEEVKPGPGQAEFDKSLDESKVGTVSWMQKRKSQTDSDSALMQRGHKSLKETPGLSSSAELVFTDADMG